MGVRSWGGASELKRVFNLDRGNGYDQTAKHLQCVQDAYSDKQASLARRNDLEIIVQAAPDLISVNYFLLYPDMTYDFTGATFDKNADGSGELNSNSQALLRTRLMQTNGDWYGAADNIKIRGGTFRGNEKAFNSIVNTFGVRNLSVTDLTIVNNTTPHLSGWAWLNGGRHIKGYNIDIQGGVSNGNDGLHSAYGYDHKWYGLKAKSGDDSTAHGVEWWMFKWMPDEGLSDVHYYGLEGDSEQTSIFKAYAPVYYGPDNTYIPGRKRGKVSGIRAFVTGWGGRRRGGGVFIQNEADPQTFTVAGSITGRVMTVPDGYVGPRLFTGATVEGTGVLANTYIASLGTAEDGFEGTYYVNNDHVTPTGNVTLTVKGVDTTLVSDIHVTGEVTCGGPEHDGVNAFGCQVLNATDVRLNLNLKFVDKGNPTHGHQRIKTGNVTAGSQTNLNTSTTYNFPLSIDEAPNVTINVLGKATMLELLQTIGANATFSAIATIEWEGGNFKVISKSTGVGSKVLMGAGTLWTPALKGFLKIEDAVDGLAAAHFGIGRLSNTRNLFTDIQCKKHPGLDGFEFYNCVNWICRGHVEGVPSGKYLFKAGVGGTSSTIDTSTMVVKSQPGGGFADPNSGRVQRWIMHGGDIQDCTVKFNVSKPATMYSIYGVLGMASRVGGTFQIAAGATTPLTPVVPDCVPRLDYNAGSPGKAEQQIKITPLTGSAPMPKPNVTNNNSFLPTLGSAAPFTCDYSWTVDSGTNAA